MRGKVAPSSSVSPVIGITPAYAGKSAERYAGGLVVQDHPRLCGEKSSSGASRCSRTGSPPPMRGKDKRHITCNNIPRITPAYAGKSCRPRPLSCRRWDHPRLCGEKFPQSVGLTGSQGSPPPMRGKVRAVPSSVVLLRITPAYAGKR